MNRRAFLTASLGVTAGLMCHGLSARTAKREENSDAAFLESARKQISKHRLGKLTIHVTDDKGRPVNGAKIKIEQLRHEFRFGSNFFAFGNCGALEEQYRERFGKVFNFATLGFYWGDYEREHGKPRYADTDQVVEYCLARGIECKGHPLVWDHEATVPDWLPQNLEEVERLSKRRVHDIVARYEGRIGVWDVVNEATHLYQKKNRSRMDDLGIAMGRREYVAEHLQVARDANPAAMLLVNDYKIDLSYYEMLDSLRENKKPLFDAVGLQCHQHGGALPLEKLLNICDLFAKLGLPLHFTETTFVSGKKADGNWGLTNAEDEERQAEAVVNFYTALFGHPAVQAITWWDFSDLGAWMGAPAGLLRGDMSPKPAYDRLLSLIKGDWWTRAEEETGLFGRASARAFYGTHRVEITLRNGNRFIREIKFRRGKENQFTLRV